MLDKYLAVLEEYYNGLEDIDPANREYPGVSALYINAVKSKSATTDKWESLKDALRSSLPDLFSLRDLSGHEAHLFKLQICIGPAGEQALFLHVSFPGQFIGFYFCDMKMSSLNHPVNLDNSDRTIPHLSYSPISKELLTYKRMVLLTVLAHFPEFKEFDNAFADYPVLNFSSFSANFSKIDLFQAMFSHSMNSIV